MSITYREDPDLKFLQFCDNDDLEMLFKFLTTDKKKELRVTEELTAEARYEKCNGNYKEIWDLIAGELQLFGADTIASMFRGGKGVLYKEILKDVCDKLKVNYNNKSDVVKIEQNLLLKIVEDSLDKMDDEAKRKFAEQFNLNVPNLSAATIMAALQIALKAGGFKGYMLATVVANALAKSLLGRGLSLSLNAGFIRGLSILAGPIGIALSILLSLPLFTGPAYRVTIPCVIQVAYMRQKHLGGAAAEETVAVS